MVHGSPKFAEIRDLVAIKKFDELVISKEYLTPEWLRQFNAQVGIKSRVSDEYAYCPFEDLISMREGNDLGRRL